MMNYHKSLYGTLEEPSEENVIGGYYGSDFVDVDGHIIFKEDFIEKFNEYLTWGNVRDNHQKAVGVMYSYDPTNWNHFYVQIHDEDVLEKARNRVYKGFSIGMKVDESGLIRVPLNQIPEEKYSHLPNAVIKRLRRTGYVMRIKDFYIFEISITDRPKNTKATITYVKGESGVDTVELPSLTEEVMENNENEVVESVSPETEATAEIVKSETEVVEDVAKSDEVVVAEETNTEDKEGAEEDDEMVFKSNVIVTLAELSAGISDLKKAIFETSSILSAMQTEISKGGDASGEAAITKSDIVIETPPSIDEFKTLIADTIRTELETFVKSEEMSTIRKGAVNVGERPEPVEKFDTSLMTKDQAYGTIAGIIARTIKK